MSSTSPKLQPPHSAQRSRSHEPLATETTMPSGRLRSSTQSQPTSAEKSRWRTSKIRHSGGFLLADAFNSMRAAGKNGKRTISGDGERERDTEQERGSKESGLAEAPVEMEASSELETDGEAGELSMLKTRSQERPSSSNASEETLDLDSTQLIDMALRINQTRHRFTSRRPSSPLLPRLAPGPDGSVGGSLQLHLQQQRRSSRTGSPRPERERSRAAFGAPGDSYRFQFSQATLARAERARRQLGLMAKYREVLGALPPVPVLGEDGQRKTEADRYGEGRQYNPLQYIRNRKVRARERKVIDGEAMGFGDLDRVSEWVEKIWRPRDTWETSIIHGETGKRSLLPAYEPAERQVVDVPVVAQAAGNKPRRPRLDWELDPADLLADVYWVERGENRQYVHDRGGHPVYPEAVTAAAAVMEANAVVAPLRNQGSLTGIGGNFVLKKGSTSQFPDFEDPDSDHVLPHHHHHHSKTARARHKLHTFKPGHKHSTSGFAHHDLLRRRGEDSEDSESEMEGRPLRPNRSATITTQTKDILDRQMQEYTARHLGTSGAIGINKTGPLSPNKSDAEEKSQRLSRPGSLMDLSANEELKTSLEMDEQKRSALKNKEKKSSLIRGRLPVSVGGRNSLEVPILGPSVDLEPSDHSGELAMYGSDSSRPASPSRKPFSRVKSMLRDRSWEREREKVRGESIERVVKESEKEREKEESGKREEAQDFESAKPVRSMTARTESSMRDILRGQGRLDGVLRGVSKLGGMLWRKEEDEESEDERSKLKSDDGKRKDSKTKKGSEASISEVDPVTPVRSNVARNKPVESLKPPRIDIQAASPVAEFSRPPSFSQEPTEHPPPSRVPSPTPEPARIHLPLDVHPVSPGPIATRPRIFKDSSSASLAASFTTHTPISRRELARIRALIVSSAITAGELSAIIGRPQFAFSEKEPMAVGMRETKKARETRGLLVDVARLGKNTGVLPAETSMVSLLEIHPIAAQTLNQVLLARETEYQVATERFRAAAENTLASEISAVRECVQREFLAETARAADCAEGVMREMAQGKGERGKRVEEGIEGMLRRKRRRLRWVRRGVWVGVEWGLVGIMWYVWAVVTVMRIVWGVGVGVGRGVRWLFWL